MRNHHLMKKQWLLEESQQTKKSGWTIFTVIVTGAVVLVLGSAMFKQSSHDDIENNLYQLSEMRFSNEQFKEGKEEKLGESKWLSSYGFSSKDNEGV